MHPVIVVLVLYCVRIPALSPFPSIFALLLHLLIVKLCPCATIPAAHPSVDTICPVTVIFLIVKNLHAPNNPAFPVRSEEHMSELQSR